MNTSNLAIFLVTPRDVSKYSKMLVYAESEDEALICANVKINPARVVQPGDRTPLIKDVYSTEAGATCEKLEVEYTIIGSDTVSFKYLDNEYCLTKEFAKAIE